MHVHVLTYHLAAYGIYFALKLCHVLKLTAEENLLLLLRDQVHIRRRHAPPSVIYV